MVKVNYRLCIDASGCNKCLEVCQNGVFTTYPTNGTFSKGSTWRINPTLLSRCIGCGSCQRSCPKGAICIGLN